MVMVDLGAALLVAGLVVALFIVVSIAYFTLTEGGPIGWFLGKVLEE